VPNGKWLDIEFMAFEENRWCKSWMDRIGQDIWYSSIFINNYRYAMDVLYYSVTRRAIYLLLNIASYYKCMLHTVDIQGAYLR